MRAAMRAAMRVLRTVDMRVGWKAAMWEPTSADPMAVLKAEKQAVHLELQMVGRMVAYWDERLVVMLVAWMAARTAA